MLPRLMPDGTLLVPRRVVDDETREIGDGCVLIGKDDPEYAAWLADVFRPRFTVDAADGNRPS